MVEENQTPLVFNPSQEIGISDILKKQLKRILITLTCFLLLLGIITILFFYHLIKKDVHKPVITSTPTNHIQISKTAFKEDDTNYIKAIYECPGDNKYCNFYYDQAVNHTSLISSITIDGENVPISRYHQFNESGIRTVIIKFKSQIKDMTRFFYDCEYLVSVDFSKLDSSEINNMSGLFYKCINLKLINWGNNFSTSKVTDMSYLFSDCAFLKFVNLSNFDTSKVSNFNYMFANCKSIKEININNFDTSKAIDFSAMFYGCESLTSIDLSNFNSNKVKLMYYMFYNCYDLKDINFGNFDTSNVISMQEMFVNCGSLEKLNLSSFNTSKLINADKMFHYCDNLVSIEQHFTSEKLISAEKMFRNCRKLEKIDLSRFVGEVLNNMSEMFSNCNSLSSIDLSNFVGEKCDDTAKIFYALPDTGILVYNSLKINRNVLLTLPSRWTKTDVRP